MTTVPVLQPARTLDIGKELALGPLRFKYTSEKIPAYGKHGKGPYRVSLRKILGVQAFGGALGGQAVHDPTISPRIVRLGQELVRIESDGQGDRILLRRATVACPHEHKLPAPQAPVYLWLSVLGRTHVTLPGRGAVPLSLLLHADPTEPSLSVSSESAHFGCILHPDCAGIYTLDDYLVELVDVVAGPDTSHSGRRWQSSGPLPVIHVQLKVTRQPHGQ